MARFEKNSLEQGEFLAINIGEQFDENSREFILKEFIKNRIKLEDFAAYYKNNHRGREIKNPRDVICAVLYGYITGNRISRKIEDLLKKHIGFMYVSNRLKIDHSVICEFKVLFQEKIEELFSQLLYILNEMGSIDWDMVVGDGTKIKAYASKNKNVGKKHTRKLMDTYQKMAEKIVKQDLELEESYREGKLEQPYYEAEKKRVSRRKKIYDSVLNQIDEYKKQVERGEKTDEEFTNLTDPESKLMSGNPHSVFIQGYNSAMMVSNNDVIIDFEAITTPEKQHTEEMVKRVEQKKAELKVDKASKYLFDSGFQDMEETIRMVEEGKDLYVDTKERDFSDKSQKRRDFKLEKIDDEYILGCRGGRKENGYLDRNNQRYTFLYSRKGCERCPFFSECYKNIKPKTQQKTVIFSEFELNNRSKIDAYLTKLYSEEGQKIYNRRIGKEHVFSNIKTQKGYVQTVYRGQRKVNLELCWVSLAHNFMKYAQYLRK